MWLDLTKKSAMASFNHRSVFTVHCNVEVDEFEYEFDCHFKMCCLFVRARENANLTNAQEKLLLCYWKSSISMHHNRNLCMYILQNSQMETFLNPNHDQTQVCIYFNLPCTKVYVWWTCPQEMKTFMLCNSKWLKTRKVFLPWTRAKLETLPQWINWLSALQDYCWQIMDGKEITSSSIL